MRNHMPQQTIDLYVNPSEETIRLGPLAVRFLIRAEDSTGTIAAFELFVPKAQRLVLTWTVANRRRAGASTLHSARRRSSLR